MMRMAKSRLGKHTHGWSSSLFFALAMILAANQVSLAIADEDNDPTFPMRSPRSYSRSAPPVTAKAKPVLSH